MDESENQNPMRPSINAIEFYAAPIETKEPRSTKIMRRFSGLPEALVALAIVAAVGWMVQPTYTFARNLRHETAMWDELRYMRSQIMIYRAEHDGLYPGFPDGDPTATPSAAIMIAQLSKYTDKYGNVSDQRTETHTFGPYITQMPVNPITQTPAVRILHRSQDVLADYELLGGWVYVPSQGVIAADAPGEDMLGVRYRDY